MLKKMKLNKFFFRGSTFISEISFGLQHDLQKTNKLEPKTINKILETKNKNFVGIYEKLIFSVLEKKLRVNIVPTIKRFKFTMPPRLSMV